ncbi:hypothetical protein TNCV_2108461 [Trichonephila clavipes]|nr:hypothetical protein TNCV_2108461 [Trichonephila clavipes]
MNIILKDDIPVCQRARRLSCSDNLSPMETKHSRFSSGLDEKEKGISTAADSGQSGWPLWHAAKASSLRAQAQLIRTETFGH